MVIQIIFGSVRFGFYKNKVIKLNFKKTETGSNRPVSVRFFRTKTGSNRFGSVFSGLARFSFGFSVWLGFFPVWFGFSGFRLIKLKPNQK